MVDTLEASQSLGRTLAVASGACHIAAPGMNCRRRRDFGNSGHILPFAVCSGATTTH